MPGTTVESMAKAFLTCEKDQPNICQYVSKLIEVKELLKTISNGAGFVFLDFQKNVVALNSQSYSKNAKSVIKLANKLFRSGRKGVAYWLLGRTFEILKK